MRKSLSKKIRFEIFKRDNFKCRYCGITIGPDVILEVDHINPVVNGGDNSPLNLITSCFDCNRGKSKRLLSSSDKIIMVKNEKVSLLSEQKRQLTAYIEYQREQATVIDRLCLEAVTPLMENENDMTMPFGWKASVGYFLKKLPLIEVRQAAGIAVSKHLYGKQKFIYFCGVCHNKIKQNGGYGAANQS